MTFGFARPWALLFLLALPLYAVLVRRWSHAALIHSRTSVLARLERAGTRVIGRLPGWLRAGALAALILALAAPRTGLSSIDVQAEGIAIMLVVDVSSSMLAEDFRPHNRLTVARQKLAEFVRGREYDRIGLVAFAGEALTQVPVTIDYDVIYQAIENLDVGVLEDGTAIGTGIATGANRLRNVPGKSRVMIVMTDGENNRGEIDPLTAAKAAATVGLKIYTIGVGTEGVAPIPVARSLFGYEYANLPVHIDEKLMREIAALGGGQYFRATSAEALDSVYKSIDALEKSQVRVHRYVDYTPRYLPFVVAGIVLLLLEWLIRASRWGRVP
jgi:Ca-activated chloride channel family protein